jgi:hypothetical protein
MSGAIPVQANPNVEGEQQQDYNADARQNVRPDRTTGLHLATVRPVRGEGIDRGADGRRDPGPTLSQDVHIWKCVQT